MIYCLMQGSLARPQPAVISCFVRNTAITAYRSFHVIRDQRTANLLKDFRLMPLTFSCAAHAESDVINDVLQV